MASRRPSASPSRRAKQPHPPKPRYAASKPSASRPATKREKREIRAASPQAPLLEATPAAAMPAETAGGPAERALLRRLRMVAVLVCVAAAVLAILLQAGPSPAPPPALSRRSPRPPRSSPRPPLMPPPPDDDDEILCDCGWTRYKGQSCQESRGKSGFPCWASCCSESHK